MFGMRFIITSLLFLGNTSGKMCSICGEGFHVGNPDGIVSTERQPDTRCEILELNGVQGLIPADECRLLPSLIASVCNCEANVTVSRTLQWSSISPIASPVGGLSPDYFDAVAPSQSPFSFNSPFYNAAKDEYDKEVRSMQTTFFIIAGCVVAVFIVFGIFIAYYVRRRCRAQQQHRAAGGQVVLVANTTADMMHTTAHATHLHTVQHMEQGVVPAAPCYGDGGTSTDNGCSGGTSNSTSYYGCSGGTSNSTSDYCD